MSTIVRRVVAATPAVGALLLAIGLSALGDTPDPAEPSAAIARYFVDNRDAVFASFTIAIWSLALLLVGFVVVADRLRAAGARVAAVLVVVGVSGVAALIAAAELGYVALSWDIAESSPDAAKPLFVLTILAPLLTGPACAVLMGATAVATFRYRLFPRWYAWLCVAAAAVSGASSFAFGHRGYFYPDVQQQVVLQALALWSLVTSVVLWRDDRRRSRPA